MTVAQVLAAALARAKTISSGTLQHSGSADITVFKSFLRNQTRDMKDVGFEQMYDDLHVMATPADATTLNLIPGHTQVTVDGIVYIVGRTVTTTPGYVTIFLRIKR